MCGRYQLKMSWDRLAQLYRILPLPAPEGPALPLGDWAPRHNIAPTQTVPVLRRGPAGRVLVPCRWGFPATWLARQGRSPWSRPLVNARAEEAPAKATWRAALRERRCVVPATGFYEWLRDGRERLPVRLSPGEGPLLHFAGVWGRFAGPDGEDVDCCAILTTSASAEVAPVHDRMPVLLAPDALDAWLDPAAPPAVLTGLMRPAPLGALRLQPANTAVNSWKAEGPAVEAPDWSPAARGLSLG